MSVLNLKRVMLILGYDQKGSPMTLQITAMEFRKIMLIPGAMVVVQNTNPNTGEVSTTEFSFSRFFGWEYALVDEPETKAEVETVTNPST